MDVDFDDDGLATFVDGDGAWLVAVNGRGMLRAVSVVGEPDEAFGRELEQLAAAGYEWFVDWSWRRRVVRVWASDRALRRLGRDGWAAAEAAALREVEQAIARASAVDAVPHKASRRVAA